MKIIVNGAWHELTCTAGVARAAEPTLEKVLAEPKLRTRDLGGAADTVACGKAVAQALA